MDSEIDYVFQTRLPVTLIIKWPVYGACYTNQSHASKQVLDQFSYTSL